MLSSGQTVGDGKASGERATSAPPRGVGAAGAHRGPRTRPARAPVARSPGAGVDPAAAVRARRAPLLPAVPPDELADRMRAAGRAGREVLLELADAVKVGMTTDELDRICHDACIARGGYPSPLHYKGFPKSLCTSVNEVICHGIPDDRTLLDGDIVNCDVTIYLQGVHGDCNATFLVGDVDDDGPQARPGHPARRCGKASTKCAREHGCTRSAARSRPTPRRPVSASCARSSGTGSARNSTPRRPCSTTTTRRPISCSRPGSPSPSSR